MYLMALFIRTTKSKQRVSVSMSVKFIKVTADCHAVWQMSMSVKFIKVTADCHAVWQIQKNCKTLPLTVVHD